MPTASPISIESAIEELAREPLRHIVLLKQLLAYPGHVKAYRASDAAGTAILVALDAAASTYDCQTYPEAAVVAFISSDHPDLTTALLPYLPRDAGIVFKLSRETDLPAVRAKFSVVRRTAFISFTSDGVVEPDAEVRVTTTPGEAAFRMFETQGHERAWVEAMLASDLAFACVLDAASVCLVYENWGPVWEVGGVVTAQAHRRKGLGARVVRTALAQLSERGLKPRYQVEEHNTASIALARSVGLVPFVTITHYVTAARRPA
jgi:GNAT superfamily N-acetyltransferase